MCGKALAERAQLRQAEVRAVMQLLQKLRAAERRGLLAACRRRVLRLPGASGAQLSGAGSHNATHALPAAQRGERRRGSDTQGGGKGAPCVPPRRQARALPCRCAVPRAAALMRSMSVHGLGREALCPARRRPAGCRALDNTFLPAWPNRHHSRFLAMDMTPAAPDAGLQLTEEQKATLALLKEIRDKASGARSFPCVGRPSPLLRCNAQQMLHNAPRAAYPADACAFVSTASMRRIKPAAHRARGSLRQDCAGQGAARERARQRACGAQRAADGCAASARVRGLPHRATAARGAALMRADCRLRAELEKLEKHGEALQQRKTRLAARTLVRGGGTGRDARSSSSPCRGRLSRRLGCAGGAAADGCGGARHLRAGALHDDAAGQGSAH